MGGRRNHFAIYISDNKEHIAPDQSAEATGLTDAKTDAIAAHMFSIIMFIYFAVIHGRLWREILHYSVHW